MTEVIVGNAVGVVTTVLAQRVASRGVRLPMAARAWVVCLALISGTGTSAASPLVWDAPAGCPDAEEVRTRIAHRLGTAIPTGASLDDVVHGVEITVVRTRAGFVAEIDARALTVANDVRTLRSSRCDELANAVAVVVARLASEARGQSTKPASDTSQLSMVPDSRTPTDGRTADRRARRATDQVAVDAEYDLREDAAASNTGAANALDGGVRRAAYRQKVVAFPKWGGGLHLTGLSGAGALPSLNLGVELAGYVRRFDRFVELGVGSWVPQSAYLQAGAPAGVEVGLQVVTLRAGWGPRELPLRAWLTAEVGRIQGMGVAVDDPQGGATRWTALGGGFNVQWPMSPMARLVGAIEVMIPLERTRFLLADGRDLYQPSLAAARCSLGIEVGWR